MKAYHAFTVRLPHQLAERVRELAAEEHRSLNQTIVHLLTRALERTPETAESAPEARLSPDSASDDYAWRAP